MNTEEPIVSVTYVDVTNQCLLSELIVKPVKKERKPRSDSQVQRDKDRMARVR